MRNVSKNVLYVLFIFYGPMFFAMEQQKNNIIAQIAQASKEVLGSTDLGTVAPYVGVTLQAYYTGQDIKSYCLPSEEEQIKAFEVHEKIIFKKTKRSLIECLTVNKSSSKIGVLGGPAECEELIMLFAKIDDTNLLTDMIAAFNQNRNN